jgi:hypothetical protein
VCSNEQVILANNADINGQVFLGDDGNEPLTEGVLTTYNRVIVSGGDPVDVTRINPDPLGVVGGDLASAFSIYTAAGASAQNDNNLANPAIAGTSITLSSGVGKNRITEMTLCGKPGGALYYLTRITLQQNRPTLIIDTTAGEGGAIDIYLDGTLRLTNQSTMEVNASNGPVNIYITGNLELYNTSAIELIGSSSGSVTFYVSGTLKVYNNCSINVTGPPTACTIYSTSTSNAVHFANSCDYKGIIYAPYADIDIENNCSMYGMVWGNTIDISNSGKIYFDTALRDMFQSTSGFTLRQ